MIRSIPLIRNRINPYWLIAALVFNIVFLLLLLAVDNKYFGLLVAFIVYLDVMSISYIFNSTNENIDILEPKNVFILLYTLYSWSAAWHVIYYNEVFTSLMVVYYACIILGLIGFLVGYRHVARSQGRLAKAIASINLNISNADFFKVLLFLTITLVLLNYKYVIHMLDFSAMQPYTETSLRSTRTALSGPQALLNEFTLTLIFASILFWPLVKKRFSIISFVPFGFFAVLGTMGGNKSPLISAVTVFLIYYNYTVRRIPVILTAVVFVVLLVFATMINHVRYTTDLVEMYFAAVDIVKHDPAVLLPLNSGEFSGPPKTLLNVAKAIDYGSINYSYGYTWLSEILVYIPAALFSDRPLPSSELYMKIFMPDAPSGTGEGWFIPTEGFWAFGYLGVFFIMAAYGAIISMAYRIFRNNILNRMVLFVYAFIFFPFIITAVRTGFFGTIKATAMMLIPFLFAFLLSRKRISDYQLSKGSIVEA